jgi:hypothetical protein
MIDVNDLDSYERKGECFAITSYCNTERKLDILNRTIDNIKQFGLPIFLHAHYPIPESIQNKVHSYFYSSDNPVFNRYNKFWWINDEYRLEITEYDYYYTTVKQWNESIKILNDYEKIHMINYDSNIYPELFDISRKINKSIFLGHNYSRINEQQIFLLYFCLNKKSFDFFRDNITLRKYIGFWEQVHTQFIPHVEEYLGTFITNNDDFYIVPHTEVRFDELLKYDINTDARFKDDTEKIEGTKIFIGEFNNIAAILFYFVEKEIKVDIVVNDTERICENISSTRLVDLKLPFSEIKNLEIQVDGVNVKDAMIKRFIRLESKIYKND